MRRIIFAIIALLLSSAAAMAQSSCTYIAYGTVLTAAQWQGCFSAKQDVLSGTPLLTSGGTMTGALITAPSATTAAGFNIAPGIAPTSPNNGDMWATTAGLYIQINGSTIGPLGTGGGGGSAGGDCSGTLSALVCTKTNGTLFGTMATQNASAVDITGATLITGLPSPVNSTDAATKAYVDATATGLLIHSQVTLATVTALPANTYNNGSSGVGATLTATANAALTVDGTAVSTSQRILVKNEATTANNGIYSVTQTGSGSAPYILTRTTDANTPGTSNPSEIGFGTYVLVISGSANANTGWTVNSTVTTIGTSPITWAQFSGATGVSSIGGLTGTLACGTGLICSGSTISAPGAAGTITLGSTAMSIGGTYTTIAGGITWSGPQTFSSAITYGGVTLSNSVTGSGSMVLANAPSFPGNISVGGTTTTSSLHVGSSVFFTGIGAGPGNYYLCFITSNDSVGYYTSCGTSAKRFKNPLGEVAAPLALAALDVLPSAAPVWRYKPDQGDDRIHVGLYADDVERMDSRCAIYEDGQLKNYEDRCVIAYLVAAVKELREERR
jgi:hypothetical protein